VSRRVILLQGGTSPERAVSLESGAACGAALAAAGFAVTPLDAADPMTTLAETLAATPDAIVFNALHGAGGEDGRIQGLLDLMGLAYTHSGARASAIAMHKPTANRLFATTGLAVPPGVSRTAAALAAGEAALPVWLTDVAIVAKSANGGSSVDVAVLPDAGGLADYAKALDAGEEILIEAFAPGRELTVAVLGEGDDARPLAVTEIQPQGGGLYDYAAKYDAAIVAAHVLPAELPPPIYQDALDMAVGAHRALGCRGLSRADIRFDDASGRMTLLEVNTQPGMTALSLAPEQAALMGLSLGALCARLVEDARCG